MAAKEKENYQLEAEPLELAWDQLGDTKVQAQARNLLRRSMRKHPNGIPGKTQDDFREECEQRFGISKRDFDRFWREEIARTGAIAWRKRGPKRGPRRARKN